MTTQVRFLFVLCLAWLTFLELRWWRSCSSGAPVVQTVSVRICGHRCGACGCAIQPPPPLPPAQ